MPAVVTAKGVWTYFEPGVINTVVPAKGQFKTVVTITGLRLLASGNSAARVTLAGIEASITSSTNEKIVVIAVASPKDQKGDVKVVSDTGVQVVSSDAFTYYKNGFIVSTTPKQGVSGTRVFIYGQDLRGQGTKVVQVLLGGIQAKMMEETNFFVTVMAAA